MRAAMLDQPGKLTIHKVPDPTVKFPTDAVVRVVASGICGTDVRAYAGRPGPVTGPHCGHEFMGVVVDVGADVATLDRGDLVVAPFTFSDGTCAQCVRGMPTSCAAGGMWGLQAGGAQADGVRVPFADGTLVRVPMDEHDERIPAVLTLADVMATGHHAIHAVGQPVPNTVVVVGDGAVGLCTVLAARRAGAERVFMLGHHETRSSIATTFGATDVITKQGPEGHSLVLDATRGTGVDLVVDAVGEQGALDAAMAVCADGGVLSRVGGPHGTVDTLSCFMRNVTVTGGITPARAYLPGLLADVLSGELDPGPVFDLSVPLAHVAAGYRAMSDRTATKVLLTP